MPNTSELLSQFIKNNYLPEMQLVMFDSLSLLEGFSSNFYEDKYINIISNEMTMDTNQKVDSILMTVKKDILNIIEEHDIFVDKEMLPSLTELCSIAEFILKVQSLEDYGYVNYRLTGQGTPKAIVVNLISHHTNLSEVRAMELIESVSEKFIEALKLLIQEKEQTSTEPVIDIEHNKYVHQFFAYTKDNTSLGLRLYEQGYQNLTLKELSQMVTFSIQDYVDKNITNNFAQTALDVFSLLVITKDDYNTPHQKFKNSVSDLTYSTENVTRLDKVILQMGVDFSMVLDNNKQMELVNDNAS